MASIIIAKEKCYFPVMESLTYSWARCHGNVKVKKEIREVINNVIASGIPQEKIDKFVKAYESSYTLEGYEPSNVAARLGIGEYYYNDPLAAAKELEEYKKITSDDLKLLLRNTCRKRFAVHQYQTVVLIFFNFQFVSL